MVRLDLLDKAVQLGLRVPQARQDQRDQPVRLDQRVLQVRQDLLDKVVQPDSQELPEQILQLQGLQVRQDLRVSMVRRVQPGSRVLQVRQDPQVRLDLLDKLV